MKGTTPLIQNSFATGEVSPNIYGRTDLQKYASGCTILRNFYVDPRGGATTRPGTQYIGAFGSAGYGRLVPFSFSDVPGQTYILAFSDLTLRFIKNPGTPAYPNSSNAGLIESGGIPYEIATPYLEEDLRFLKFMQIRDVMWITREGYARRKLSRLADDNWTLTEITAPAAPSAPTITAVTITALPTGSTDPEETRYMYMVSAVDADGNEGLPSVPFISNAGINIGSTQGTVSIFWSAVADAVFYKVYKALPTQGNVYPHPSEQFGFAGYSYGTVFTDSNIVADFANAALSPHDPFAPATIDGYTITAPGAGYPVGATTITVTDVDGTGAVIYPILDTNVAGATGGISGLFIANAGSGYTAPTISALGGAGAGFTGTVDVSADSGLDPDVVSILQQRVIYAATTNKPNSIFASRPGEADDFRKSNPVVDNDGFEFALFDQKVAKIVWLQPMPGGLVIGTNSGIVQLSGGGGSESNPAAVTATQAVATPQPVDGCADITPLVINSNLLYVQTGGTVVFELQYNFFANTYAGNDLTILSSHLFESAAIVEWAYQSRPNKVVWEVMDSGALLSLTYLKAQEVYGWARHDTSGSYESIASVPEGHIDATYVSVLRNGARCIERMSQQVYEQRADAWQLDSAISIVSNYPAADLSLAAASGTNVLATASAAVFVAGDVGSRIFASIGNATVVEFVDTTNVRVDIDSPFAEAAVSVAFTEGNWRLDPVVSFVSGLDHLNGEEVYALVDGTVQGPFTVAGGSVTLSTSGSQVVVGKAFTCQLQPLYINVDGEETLQGQQKKIAAATIRVRNVRGLQYGTSFDTLREWVEDVSSTDAPQDMPYGAVGLFTGDQRLALDQVFDTGGWVCVQQEKPYPATILSIMPELAL